MDCLFCRIVAKQIPAQTVYEDDEILAFEDISPQAPFHALVIPKKHIDSVVSVREEDRDLVGRMVAVIAEIAITSGLQDHGFRVVTNTGERAGQSVKHLHFHILAGRDFSWPPG